MSLLACAMMAIAWLTRYYVVRHGAGETQVWCNTVARLDPIAAGILVALLLRGEAPQFSSKMRILMVGFATTCFALAANYWSIKADPLTAARVLAGYPAVAIGAVSLLLGILSSSSAKNRKTSTTHRSLVYLGKISYGLYVYHVLGLMISEFILPHPEATMSRYLVRDAIALSLTIAFAAASFRWLEMPFLAIKQRFTHVLSRPGG